MNNRHPWPLKKSKSWGPFWSYHLTALPIQPIHRENGPNWLNWQCCLAGSSKKAPRILIFSIAMGVDYSFYVKSIATYAPTFFRYNNSVLAIVSSCTSKVFSAAYLSVKKKQQCATVCASFSKLLKIFQQT